MVFSFETINGNLLPNNVKKVIYHKWYEWELSILHHGKYGFTMNDMNGKCLYYIMVNMVLPWMVWMGKYLFIITIKHFGPLTYSRYNYNYNDTRASYTTNIMQRTLIFNRQNQH